MKQNNLCRAAVLAGLLGAASAGMQAATVESIIAPAKRDEMLAKARQILAEQQAIESPANPFHTEAFLEAMQGGAARPAIDPGAGKGTPATLPTPSSRSLLESIATSLRPSGYFVIGGEPTLVFGQKRVKAGGLLTITFEGKEYTLEVTALDRTNFTLRLDREEFTRPIK